MSSSSQQPERQLSSYSEQELAQQLNTLAQSGQDITPLLNEMMRRVSRARMHSSHTQQQQQQQQQQIASLQQTVQQLTTTLASLQLSVASQPAPQPPATAQPKIEFEKPPKFDGQPSKLANWMFTINQYCTITRVNSKIEKQQYALSRLEGRALTWWRTECHKDPLALSTWELCDLFDGLKSAFLDVDRIAKLRERFDNIKQLTSVTAYTQAFRGLLLEFGHQGPDDETVLHAFIRGLKPDVRLDVYKARPILLSDAILIAERTDQALQLNRGRSRPVFHTRPQVPRPRVQGPTPMDIDALQQGNQQRGNAKPSSSYRQPQNAPLQKGPPGGISCWHCGKPGHTKRECRVLQRQLQGQQRGNGVQQTQHQSEQPAGSAAASKGQPSQSKN